MRTKLISLFALSVIAAGCSALSHSTAALPTADFLAIQELRDTTYFQNRSIGVPFDATYFNARDSAFSHVAIDPVYLHSLEVDDLRSGDSAGDYNGTFFQAEKSVLISTYKILEAHQ